MASNFEVSTFSSGISAFKSFVILYNVSTFFKNWTYSTLYVLIVPHFLPNLVISCPPTQQPALLYRTGVLTREGEGDHVVSQRHINPANRMFLNCCSS